MSGSSAKNGFLLNPNVDPIPGLLETIESQIQSYSKYKGFTFYVPFILSTFLQLLLVTLFLKWSRGVTQKPSLPYVNRFQSNQQKSKSLIHKQRNFTAFVVLSDGLRLMLSQKDR